MFGAILSFVIVFIWFTTVDIKKGKGIQWGWNLGWSVVGALAGIVVQIMIG